MKNSLYDLEQAILSVWQSVYDLKIVANAIYDDEMTDDQGYGSLIGISDLMDLKFNKLFSLYEKVINEQAKK